MTAVSTIPRETHSPNDRLIAQVISGLMVLLGVAALVLLAWAIAKDDAFTEARNGNGESPILSFLDSFGITLPAVTILMSVIIIQNGIRLLQMRMSTASWVQVILLWLTVGSVLAGFWRFYTAGRPETALGSYDYGESLNAAAPFFALAVPLAIGLWWISNAIERNIFFNDETLTSTSTRVAWNLLVPTVIVLLLVAARPLEETFITSLTDKRFGSAEPVKFIAFDNYTALLSFRVDSVDCRKEENGECRVGRDGATTWELIDREALTNGYRTATVIGLGDSGIALSGKDEKFLLAVNNTLRFTVISVVLELLLGLAIALIVNAKFPGRGLMRTAMLVPWAIPTVVSARLWETMLRDNPSGIFNRIALDLGLIAQSKPWLADEGLMMPAIIMVDLWKTAPFMALLILAGLQTIPGELYEAADVDGASRVRQFFSITLPLLRPTIAVALVFRTLDALRAFDVFNVLLNDRLDSMATYNFQQLVAFQQAGYAASIGVVMFIIILIFTVVYVRMLGIDSE